MQVKINMKYLNSTIYALYILNTTVFILYGRRMRIKYQAIIDFNSSNISSEGRAGRPPIGRSVVRSPAVPGHMSMCP